MPELQQNLPKWIIIVSAIFALLEIMVSISLIISPASVIEEVALTAKGVDYVVQMWAVRQFALGVIFAVAAYRRSAPMLTLAYIFFLVMFIGDLIIGVTQKNGALILSAIVMCIIASVLIYSIHKKR